jgi:hypothetical protein
MKFLYSAGLAARYGLPVITQGTRLVQPLEFGWDFKGVAGSCTKKQCRMLLSQHRQQRGILQRS